MWKLSFPQNKIINVVVSLLLLTIAYVSVYNSIYLALSFCMQRKSLAAGASLELTSMVVRFWSIILVSFGANLLLSFIYWLPSKEKDPSTKRLLLLKNHCPFGMQWLEGLLILLICITTWIGEQVLIFRTDVFQLMLECWKKLVWLTQKLAFCVEITCTCYCWGAVRQINGILLISCRSDRGRPLESQKNCEDEYSCSTIKAYQVRRFRKNEWCTTPCHWSTKRRD